MKNTKTMSKKNEPKEIVLMNSQAWLENGNYTYEDYLDYCDANGIEPADEDSHEFFDWQLEECSFDVECDLDNIKECKMYKDATYLITGSLGLWYGRPDIAPTKVTGLYEAIMKCWGNCDDCEVKLNVETGVIEVYAHHHDSTNCFEIHQLRDYCVNAYDNAYDDWDYGHTEQVVVKKGWLQKIRNLYAIGA